MNDNTMMIMTERDEKEIKIGLLRIDLRMRGDWEQLPQVIIDAAA